MVNNKTVINYKGAYMKTHDDSWTSFALTGDPKAYLKYKQRITHTSEGRKKEQFSETN